MSENRKGLMDVDNSEVIGGGGSIRVINDNGKIQLIREKKIRQWQWRWTKVLS